MAQPPAYNRNKDFTEDFGNETDHSSLNAELDRASNSINDIRSNLAILQADDGKLRPAVVTADSISADLRVSLVEGVVMDAQAMLEQSLAAADASSESAQLSAASSLSAKSSADRAKTISDGVQSKADEIVQASYLQAKTCAEAAGKSAISAANSASDAGAIYSQIENRAQDIVQEASDIATSSANSAEESADEAKLHAEIANQRGIPVGTIVMFSASTPPAGYLKADGAAVGRATYPELYAAIGTTYGAGDGSTTFNLPDLINRFAQGSSTPGQKIAAGLPNITGAITNIASGGTSETAATGALSVTQRAYNNKQALSTTVGHTFQLGLNATGSSLIYGASNTVQPPALTLLPCIKAFDAAVNPGLIDITGLANDVNNLSVNKTDMIAAAHAAMPSDSYVPLTLQPSGGTYIASADGYFFSTAYASASNSAFINFTCNNSWGIMTNILAGSANRVFLPVKKGSVTTVEYAFLMPNSTLGFFYCEGSKP